MGEEIIGEDRRTPEEEVPNGGIAGWFGALFARPVSVRVALDGLADPSSVGVGISLGKGGLDAVRALYVKKRRDRLSHGSGKLNEDVGSRVVKTGTPLAGGRGERWPSGESRGGGRWFGRW